MIFRTATLTEHFDLNTVCRGDGFLFVRDGVGVAGRDAVQSVSEDESIPFLRSLTPSRLSDPTVASNGPVLFALVPFSPKQTAEFILPRIVFRKTDGQAPTVTMIGDSEDDVTDEKFQGAIAAAITAPPPRPSSNSYRVAPRTAVGHYLFAAVQARDAVRAGSLQKAVIARDIEVHADDPIDVHAILLRLRASFGSSYRYCVNNIIGASPELWCPSRAQRFAAIRSQELLRVLETKRRTRGSLKNWWPAPRIRSSTELSSTWFMTRSCPFVHISTGKLIHQWSQLQMFNILEQQLRAH